MYTFAFVDRTNISLALPSMSRDLHMGPVQAGAASGIFFLGYVLLQIPLGYLASRWSPKKLVACMLVAWGLCSTATGFIHSWSQLLVVRFLLGLAEAGVWPATLVLLSRWFPRAERARANAYWMLCLPVAVVLSSPISGWILSRWNWRVLLVSEGLLPILWLAVWLVGIEDEPNQARWISAAEREFLNAARYKEMNDPAISSRQSLISSLLSRQVLIMMAILFLVSTGNYGYLFWLPSVLESPIFHSGQNPNYIVVGILNALPYVVAGIAMVVISRHSDRKRERAKHVAVALLWAGICLTASAFVSAHSPVWAFGLLCLVSAGSFGMSGPFWAIPTETLPPAIAGAALGLIQVSNLGGLVGPTLIGYLDKTTGGFTSAFVVLGIGWIAAALLCGLIKQPKT
ncbi:MAG: MFS transporter, partial [Candidatus Acidiferrales bacterium]